MAFFSNVAGSRPTLGKRSHNVSESTSVRSWGSELNLQSGDEDDSSVQPRNKRVRSTRKRAQDDDFSLKTSTSSDEESVHHTYSGRGKKTKCFSKNAIMARENRLKKKKYVEGLENELEALRQENSKLKISLGGYSQDVELVRKENRYLRNVLASSKEISQLIRAVNLNSGLPTTSSVKAPNCRPAEKQDQASIMCSEVPDAAKIVPLDTYAVPLKPTYSHTSPRVMKVQKDFPIAVEDVALSNSAPEDDDDLDLLCATKDSPFDIDFDDVSLGDLGFGPNALGDWLDGDEAMTDIGVCLHIAKKKVSLEFCSKCNESASCNWLNESITV